MGTRQTKNYRAINLGVVRVVVQEHGGDCSPRSLNRYIRSHKSKIMKAYDSLLLYGKPAERTFGDLLRNQEQYLKVAISQVEASSVRKIRAEKRLQDKVDNEFTFGRDRRRALMG